MGGYPRVVNPRMVRVLGVFQYCVARKLMGWLPWQRLDRKWDYTLEEVARAGSAIVVAARSKAGFGAMET